nr:hypothetical protein [uncultured Cohaesibacter sp.]
MAKSIKIASTPSAGLAPIGGVQERDFDRIVDSVTDALGEDVASIFAEPVGSRDGSRIDWYTTHFGRIAALDTLAEDERAAVLQRLEQHTARIRRFADDIAATGNAGDRALGKALNNALEVPGTSHVYAVNGNPVLVAWGYRHSDARPLSGGISKVAATRGAVVDSVAPQVFEPQAVEEPIPEPLPPQPAHRQELRPEKRKRRVSWLAALLWALLLLLIAAILYLLLKACSISAVYPWVNYCPGHYQSDLDGLQQEIRLLENALAFKNENCAASADNTDPIAEAELSKRLEERNAGAGALQVSLAWNGLADLDLAVRCGGAVVWFSQPNNCGATLDTDSNGRGIRTDKPVENIVWPTEAAIPAGDLPVFVSLFSHNGFPVKDIPYTLRVVRRRGDEVISQYSINGVAAGNWLQKPMQIGLANKQ